MAVVIIVLVVGIVPWMAIILDLMVLACASFAWHFPPPLLSRGISFDSSHARNTLLTNILFPCHESLF